MKKFLLFMFFPLFLFSQKIEFSGRLVDAISKEPIPYANISFLNSYKGISTTEKGEFSMNLSKKYLFEKVHISCLNYKDTIVFANELQEKTFYLNSKEIVLDEIILEKKVDKSMVLGDVKNRVRGIHTMGMRMVAKFFPKDKRSNCCNYLKSINVYFADKSNHRKKSKFRIRIFNKSAETGLPDEDVLNVNLPIEIDENQKSVKIDLSKFDIEMPENGIFVAFEKLFIPFNQYSKKDSETENEYYYAPIIGYTKYKRIDRNDNFYYFEKGSWKEAFFSKNKILKAYTPSISMTLTN